jgi:hypothetical protein
MSGRTGNKMGAPSEKVATTNTLRHRLSTLCNFNSEENKRLPIITQIMKPANTNPWGNCARSRIVRLGTFGRQQ